MSPTARTSPDAAAWTPPGLELRTISEDEFAPYCEAVSRQFGEDLPEGAVALWRAHSDLERSFAAFDRGEIVATVQTTDADMLLPGGTAARCAAVTAVGVRTTHRRRGLMTALLARAVEDARARGEPLSALYASEHPIYGRYGYGPAVPALRWAVPRAHAALDPPVASFERVEMLAPSAAAAALRDVEVAAQRWRPGGLLRSEDEWRAILDTDPSEWRDGYTRRYIAVAPGEAAAVYRLKDDGDAAGGLLRVELLVGADPEAEARMFAFVSSVDLVRELALGLRPPDDPLLARLAHPDRAKVRAQTSMYVRLLDLPACIAARGYDADGELVVEVSDAFLPDNAGRWMLTVDGGTGHLTNTDAPADLTCDVRDLGAVYLGGVRASTLARAGRLREATPGAAQRLDRAFATEAAPWQPWDF